MSLAHKKYKKNSGVGIKLRQEHLPQDLVNIMAKYLKLTDSDVLTRYSQNFPDSPHFPAFARRALHTMPIQTFLSCRKVFVDR